MDTARTPEEVIAIVRAMRPDSNPIAAEFDDMAAVTWPDEKWYVWFDSEENEPEAFRLPAAGEAIREEND